MPPKHKRQSPTYLFSKRRKRRVETPESDDDLKRQWLRSHRVTRLEPGWSRYGYGPLS